MGVLDPNDKILTTATARNKKVAEQEASRMALELLDPSVTTNYAPSAATMMITSAAAAAAVETNETDITSAAAASASISMVSSHSERHATSRSSRKENIIQKRPKLPLYKMDE